MNSSDKYLRISKSNHHPTNKKPQPYMANYSTRTPYTLPKKTHEIGD